MNPVSKDGDKRNLISELENLYFRVKHLKHTDELTPEVLARIIERLKALKTVS